MNSVANIQKTISLMVWVLYRKDEVSQTGWVPCAAFVCKNNADSWSNTNLGAMPHTEITKWNTVVYAAQTPAQVEVFEDWKFTINVQGSELPVIDLVECPEALPSLEAAMSLIAEHRRMFAAAQKSEEGKKSYHAMRALVRAATDEVFMLAPKKTL